MNDLIGRTEGLEIMRSVAYGEGARRTLDVYRPNDASGLPVVVFFYGGSWQSGNKRISKFVGTPRATRLHRCCRTIGFIPGRYPSFIEDGALALRWVRDNAARLGGGPSKLFVMGHWPAPISLQCRHSTAADFRRVDLRRP